MEIERERSRNAQKKTAIELTNADLEMQAPTIFHGFDSEALELNCEVLGIEGTVLITSETPFYATTGGQVGDQGTVSDGAHAAQVVDTTKNEFGVIFHKIDQPIDVTEAML